jgi:hypothetical protein
MVRLYSQNYKFISHPKAIRNIINLKSVLFNPTEYNYFGVLHQMANYRYSTKKIKKTNKLNQDSNRVITICRHDTTEKIVSCNTISLVLPVVNS